MRLLSPLSPSAAAAAVLRSPPPPPPLLLPRRRKRGEGEKSVRLEAQWFPGQEMD